jgi:hypothetical protein
MRATAPIAQHALRSHERRTVHHQAGPQHLNGWREILILIGAWLVYFGIRALSEGRAEVARAHARSVLHLEQTLGIAWEQGAQRPLSQHQWLLTAANWVYVWGHWPVIAASALWLFHRRPAAYRELRLAFLLSGAIGVVIFALYPVAPPRLAGFGLLDSVTRYSHAYRALQPRELTNIYAAFPSLHFGWNLLVGIALFRCAPRRAVRIAAALTPAAMGLAVVATANHFVIDVPAGAVVALTGLFAARWILHIQHSHSTPTLPADEPSAAPRRALAGH